MGSFIAQDWDLTKPLWEMILVENYRDEDGAQCALISRGYTISSITNHFFYLPWYDRHHTLADGQGTQFFMHGP